MKYWIEENWPYVIVVTIVAGVLGLVGYGIYLNVTAPHEGVIHNKSYTPAHSIIQCTTTNKTTICTPQYIPDDYEFDLYKSKDDHGWRQVDAITYHKYKIGDYYNGS